MKEQIDFIFMIILYFKIFYRKWKEKGNDILLLNTLMYIYLIFVLYFTLMPIIVSIPKIIFNYNSHSKMNLVPFIDVTMGRGDFIRQIGLNILMTVPFGFLLPLVTSKNIKLIKIIFYTFILSFSIEILQLITPNGRSSDITDIITNVTGGIIGFIAYLIVKPLLIKVLKKLTHNQNIK